MKTNQRFVVAPDFFRDLETEINKPTQGLESFQRRKNYNDFLSALMLSDAEVFFNCQLDRYQKLKNESEIVGFLVQQFTETGKQTWYSRNSSAMCFLEQEAEPDNKQRNYVYLKSFSKGEKERAEKYGVLLLSPSEIIGNSFLYKDNGRVVEKGQSAQWEISGINTICNTIIIADRYILTLDKSKNLFPILNSLIPKNITERFTVIIYTMMDEKSYLKKSEYFKKEWRTINKWLSSCRDFEIELVIYVTEPSDFHNRHILTNYIIFDCPAGFDLIGSKVLNRRFEGGMYSSGNNNLTVQVATQNTKYSVVYPLFSYGNNSVAIKDYVLTIKELKNAIKKKRLRIDKRFVLGDKGYKQSSNCLFEMVPD